MNYLTVKNRLAGNFPALTHRDFRYFWTGQCISLLGTWMQRTAQQWLVYSITKSPLLLGILGVFQFLPALLFSLFAGVIIDRFSKKNILIITQSILMLQSLILAFLVWSGYVRYWHILLLGAILGFVNTFDMPTRQSFFIELVGKKDLVNAIALNSTIVNLAKIVGPAIAGLIMTCLGVAGCFLLNGVSFIAVIIGLFKIETSNNKTTAKKGNIISDVKAGLRYIISSEILLTAVLAMFIVGSFDMNVDVINPVFAKEVLHKEASGYSILMSAMGVGSLISALIIATKSRKKPNKRLIYKSAIFLSIILMVLGFIDNYFISIILMGATGFFNLKFMNAVNSTIQLNTNDEYRGRAMSVYSLMLFGTGPFGNLFAGSVTEKFGANMGFFSGGIAAICLLGFIPIFIKKYLF